VKDDYGYTDSSKWDSERKLFLKKFSWFPCTTKYYSGLPAEDDYINEVRVNDVPTNITIIGHKVNKNGNVDSYLVYGFKGNRKVSQLHHSGDTGITTHRYFLFSQDGSPERPGKPISSPVVCK
ncbi:hypothetical protein Q4R04_18565, partial [Morganella morganii]